MISIMSLWAPILLSSVLVFVAAGLLWTALPVHRLDWRPIPGQERLFEAIRAIGLGRGQYAFPHMLTPEGAKNPDVMKQMEEGPVGFLVLKEPGPPNMTKQLGLYLVFVLVVTYMIAYLVSVSMPRGAPFVDVMRAVTTATVLAHGAAEVPGAIWFGRTWKSVLKSVLIDALIYGLITGAVFGWLWPS